MIRLLFILICFSAFSQTPDLTACAVNIVDGANIQTQRLEAYQNLILLQSGTRLRIKFFEGSTTFVHGYKELEEGDGFISPVLIIDKCKKGSTIHIGPRITARLGKSCGGIVEPDNSINIFNNGN